MLVLRACAAVDRPCEDEAEGEGRGGGMVEVPTYVWRDLGGVWRDMEVVQAEIW